jgi:ATP synthase protein I
MSGDKGGGEGSIRDRLAAARRKQGLDAPPQEPESSGSLGDLSPMGTGLRVGVEMLSAMVVALAIGWWLDSKLHTSPFLLILFVLLGGAAGIANVWRLMAPKRKPGPGKK